MALAVLWRGLHALSRQGRRTSIWPRTGSSRRVTRGGDGFGWGGRVVEEMRCGFGGARESSGAAHQSGIAYVRRMRAWLG
ncbi:hypothetical protein E2562_039304 [Oryza meyeriana var. granulata]|uniref:Uncharacterized protein n=1 Tax=Oryza meyeriana var. granulata TaxID=110450 RepID=A0A6G1E9E1_9ORYZ|nr:hypothetical protein E2562_039304 [Oryza meyeriana var. granulata]